MALSITQLQHLMKCKWWITNFIHTYSTWWKDYSWSCHMYDYILSYNGRKSGLVNNCYRDVSIWSENIMQEERRNFDQRRKFTIFVIPYCIIPCQHIDFFKGWPYGVIEEKYVQMLMENIDFNIEIN